MTLDDLSVLASPAVDDWLRELQQSAQDELRLQNVLRGRLPAGVARAAAELIWLRRKAVAKFPGGRVRWFDREGYEQSTGELISEYRAKRFAEAERICDACAGIGGDGVALAAHAEVVGVEVSPARCGMTRLNARDVGCHRLQTVCADATRWLPPRDYLFLDPSRRKGHQRFVTVQELTPSWDFCVEGATSARGAAIKLSPLMHPEDYYLDAEIEFLSSKGECRDQTLWFGALKRGRLRATVLPSGESVSVDDPSCDEVAPVGEWVYVPDPAVARAALSAQCAARFGLRLVSRDLEIVTGDQLVETALLRAYRVAAVIPWERKLLRKELRRLNARPEVVVRRGTRASEEQLRSLFPKKGERRMAALALNAPKCSVVVLSDLG